MNRLPNPPHATRQLCSRLAALTVHIPNPGEHVVRYYGWYSNVSRGKRKKAQAEKSEEKSEGALTEMVEVPPPAISRALKHRRAHVINQVYEADPPLCPRCGCSTRIIAFIDQAAVIEKILTHLGRWPAHAHSPPASNAA